MSRPAPRRLNQVRVHPELIALGKRPYLEASRLRKGAIQAALQAMPPHEHHILRRHAQRLAQNFNRLGMAGALEVLAAIGIAMDDAGWPKGDDCES